MTLLGTVYDTISGSARSVKQWVFPSQSASTEPSDVDIQANTVTEIVISQEGPQSSETVHKLHPDSHMSCPDEAGNRVFCRLPPNRRDKNGQSFWAWPGPVEKTKIPHGCLYQGGVENKLADTLLESQLKNWEDQGYTIINKTGRDASGMKTTFSINIEGTDEWNEPDLVKVGTYRHFIPQPPRLYK